MSRWVVTGLASATFFAAGCGDTAGPGHRPDVSTPLFSHTASSGIALDQHNGTLGQTGVCVGAPGPCLIKGFDPTNPHRGSTIIATFYWVGSTNIIDSVTDHLTTSDFPRVGNQYRLVEYITAGGLSMATYVATNIQGFPDPNPTGDSVLAVRANLAAPIPDGGVKLSAWTGVEPAYGSALGAHRSAAGSGSTPTVAAPGAIPLRPGALAYAVTMSNGRVGLAPPEGFTSIGGTGSDALIQEDARYRVQDTVAGTVDPRWTWFFAAPSTWLASVIALNPAGAAAPTATRLMFAIQPSATLPFSTIKPAVQVAAVDDAGNPAGTFTGVVTIAIGFNGGVAAPGTLSGTTSVAALEGVATFSDLSIDQPGTYTLVVTAPGLTGAESVRFTIGTL